MSPICQICQHSFEYLNPAIMANKPISLNKFEDNDIIILFKEIAFKIAKEVSGHSLKTVMAVKDTTLANFLALNKDKPFDNALLALFKDENKIIQKDELMRSITNWFETSIISC